MEKGKALQVVRTDTEKNEVSIVDENLEIVNTNLSESGADAVSIVAIMGPFRTGKSFLCDFLLRYFRGAEKASAMAEQIAKAKQEAFKKAERAAMRNGKSAEDAKIEAQMAGDAAASELGTPVHFPPPRIPAWRCGGEKQPVPAWIQSGEENPEQISEGNLALKSKGGGAYREGGFDWRGGMEKCTEGIWLYSRPFILRDADGRKIAVLLMDTEGAFDCKKTKEQSATIFGLTSLLASKLLYNMQNMVDETRIESLDYFTTFAKAAMRGLVQDGDHGAFGHLHFIVRDWQHYDEDGSHDFERCNQEMANHMDSILDPSGTHKDTVGRLREIFSSIGVTGLTHPGMAVAKKTFEGHLDQVESDFLQLLDELMRTLFGGTFPVPSAPLNTEITPTSFNFHFRSFVDVFRDNQGSAVGLRDAFVKVEVNKKQQEMIALFEKDLDKQAPSTTVLAPEELERIADSLQKKYLERFQKDIAEYKLSNADAELQYVKQNIERAFEYRTKLNNQIIEGATLKLVASPVVGFGGYMVFCHHLLVVPIGGYMVYRSGTKNLARFRKTDPNAQFFCMPMFWALTRDAGEFTKDRLRDVQAIHIVAARCTPDKAMGQAGKAFQQARAVGTAAAVAGAAGGEAGSPSRGPAS